MSALAPSSGSPAPRRRVTKEITDPSQTKQSFRVGSTIDAILKKYALAGMNTQQIRDVFAAGIAQQPYGIQRAHDYQRELNQVIAVQNYFDTLPATTRDKFSNDPHAMLTWLADPKNADEGRKLKLLPELPGAAPPTPPATPPVPPTPV